MRDIVSRRVTPNRAMTATCGACATLFPASESSALAYIRQGVDNRLLHFASVNGLRITSGRHGKHNVGSKHYRGLAIDVSCRSMTAARIEHLKRSARAAGLYIRDERRRPRGQKIWSGPHLHIEVP